MLCPTNLLILGNGFDLHCGLKSNYKDFFRSEILDIYSEKCGYPTIKEGCSGFWENLLFEYYKVNGKDDYNWCDIETIIKNTLQSIYFGTNSSEVNLNAGIYRRAVKFYKVSSQLFSKDNLNPIEKFLFDYCLSFISGNEFKSIESLKFLNRLTVNLLHQLNNLEKRFCKYLKSCIVNSYNGQKNTEYIIKAINLIRKLTNFADSDYKYMDKIICPNENNCCENSASISEDAFVVKNIKKELALEFDNLKTTNILSFNYTAIFDILGVESPCLYNNVHGKLCNENCLEECTGSTVIFGIDDALIQTRDANSELRLFSKTYRKMHDTASPLSILPPDNKIPMKIKFYGHSLSEADHSYFQSIFDYYDLYGNSNVSLIFYYSKGYEQNDAIYRLISSYGKTLTNQAQGKNLLHKLLLENRLKIKDI